MTSHNFTNIISNITQVSATITNQNQVNQLHPTPPISSQTISTNVLTTTTIKPNISPTPAHTNVVQSTSIAPPQVNQTNTANANSLLQTELSSIHPNPDVVTAILRFEEGEMQHKVDKCATCIETRLVFHATPPVNKTEKNETAPVQLKPWVI